MELHYCHYIGRYAEVIEDAFSVLFPSEFAAPSFNINITNLPMLVYEIYFPLFLFPSFHLDFQNGIDEDDAKHRV